MRSAGGSSASRAAIAFIAVAAVTADVLCGCKASPEPVWIDLSRVERAFPAARFAPPKLPEPPSPLPPKTISFQGARTVTVPDPFSTGKINASKEFVQSRKAAERLLLRQLADYYEKLADTKSSELLNKLGDPYSRMARDLEPKVKARFDLWANERSPWMLRLALAYGKFVPPDRIPKPPDQASALAQMRYKAALSAATHIAAIDAKYDADITALFNGAKQRAQAEQLAAITQIEQYEVSLRDAAQREAEAQLGKPPKDLGLTLESPHPLTLASVPGGFVSLPAGAKLPNPPKVDSSLNLVAFNRQGIMHDLRIWLALRGFSLARNRSGVRDETGDFIKWRKGLTVGR